MNSAKYPNIVILGGGTAGWITANLIKKHLPEAPVILIASQEIGVIGVGEGSTPHLKLFFDELGIAEKDWMPASQATYKNGIRFQDWSTRPGFNHYFHPFASKIDAFSAPIFIQNTLFRRQGYDIHAHPDRYYLAALLAENKQAPVNPENFPFDIGYGYHFDAIKMAEFLQSNAEQNGVSFIEGKLGSAKLNPNGTVSSLVLQNGQTVSGDFFIDCSGFNGLLIEKVLKSEFVSFRDNLFCDSAIALPTPPQDTPEPQTIATAMSNGWAWQIPLTNRVGNGYVYASDYINADQAETELRKKLGLLNSDVEARHLKMRVGRRKQHWLKNVLAIGLSQGFIEPLEATAIHLTIETVKQFIGAWQDGNFSNQHQDAFNKLTNQHFESVRDYIVTHYKLNSREDSQFWIDNRNNQKLSVELVNVLNGWLQGKDLNRVLEEMKIPGYYPPFSWHCILAGYGIYPAQEQLKAAPTTMQRFDLKDTDEFVRRSALNFPPHTNQLNLIHKGS